MEAVSSTRANNTGKKDSMKSETQSSRLVKKSLELKQTLNIGLVKKFIRVCYSLQKNPNKLFGHLNNRYRDK